MYRDVRALLVPFDDAAQERYELLTGSGPPVNDNHVYI